MHAAPSTVRRAVALASAFAAFATWSACGGDDLAEDSARAAADTATAAAAPAAAGPLPPVTSPADADLVMDATEFKLTDENFAVFLRASEALSFMRARDMGVRTLLDQAGSSGDSTTGSVLERLENHPQIKQAINSARMTVKDYYVMAIALANAQRFAASPDAAPPTPVGRENAAWVARNRAKVDRVQTWGAVRAQ